MEVRHGYSSGVARGLQGIAGGSTSKWDEYQRSATNLNHLRKSPSVISSSLSTPSRRIIIRTPKAFTIRTWWRPSSQSWSVLTSCIAANPALVSRRQRREQLKFHLASLTGCRTCPDRGLDVADDARFMQLLVIQPDIRRTKLPVRKFANPVTAAAARLPAFLRGVGETALRRLSAAMLDAFKQKLACFSHRGKRGRQLRRPLTSARFTEQRT
jgi:hypothetical protein